MSLFVFSKLPEVRLFYGMKQKDFVEFQIIHADMASYLHRKDFCICCCRQSLEAMFLFWEVLMLVCSCCTLIKIHPCWLCESDWFNWSSFCTTIEKMHNCRNWNNENIFQFLHGHTWFFVWSFPVKCFCLQSK